MITLGMDIGAGATKVVLVEDGLRIIAKRSFRTGGNLQAAAETACERILADCKLRKDQVSYVATTGYGRYQYPERDLQITDITCHARGVHFLFPKTRCILDIGAQSSRAIKIDDSGHVKKFRINEKCAAGGGRFLEKVARYLELRLEDLGCLSLESKEPQSISSVCAVLAETEIINYVTLGKRVEDIIMGAHYSIVDRVLTLLRQVGIEPEVTLTGGVAANIGVVRAVENRVGMPVNVSEDSPFAGALGAAILAYRRLLKKQAA